MDDAPAVSPCLESVLDLHEQFEEALESSRKLAYQDFERQAKELLEKIESKKAELESYFREREQELEASRLVFRVALNTTLAASIDLQQAIAQLDVPELNVHIQQGKKLLKETHVALSYLVSAVHGTTIRHLVLGSTLLGVHIILFLQATRRREHAT